MSAGMAVQAALVAALRGDATLAGLTVFDAAPVRAALPYAVVEDPVLADWSAKDFAGRQARVAVVLHDAGERPERVRGLVGAVEDRGVALAGMLDGGWTVAGVVLVRSRVAKAAGERWIAGVEFQVRVWRAES